MTMGASLRIAINGACGRMGTTVGKLACAADGEFRIAAPLERKGHTQLGQDYGPILGRAPLGVCVVDRLAVAADALIDFSAPEAAIERLAECEERKVALVVGTTGLDKKGLARFEKASKKIPILIASNMSLGMNLMFQLVEEVARKLGKSFDIEIVETHHRNKVDAPSGSALTLGQAAARGRGVDPDRVTVYAYGNKAELWWKANADLPEYVQKERPEWYAKKSAVYKNLQPEIHDVVPQFGLPFIDGWSYEEWFGIASLGNGENSPFVRQLRPAYHILKKVLTQ